MFPFVPLLKLAALPLLLKLDCFLSLKDGGLAEILDTGVPSSVMMDKTTKHVNKGEE
jgi:hypothetical protein